MDTKKAQTDVEKYSLTEIPLESLKRLSLIFKEGTKRYGKHNWRLGVHDTEYTLERANHALKHLLIYIHSLETGEYVGESKYNPTEADPLALVPHREDDLAKVMWFCATTMELERLRHASSNKQEGEQEAIWISHGDKAHRGSVSPL